MERRGSEPDYLGLGVVRADAGGAQLDHVGEQGDGLGRGLGRLGQPVLARRRPGHQHLGVLHQGLGCLQDALPGEMGEREEEGKGREREGDQSRIERNG